MAMLAMPEQQRWTVRGAAAAAQQSVSSTHTQLLELRRAGCVEWALHRKATLRLAVYPIRGVGGVS